MNKILILAVLGMFFISGCGSTDTPNVPSESPYIGGTQGINAEFLEMGVFNDNTNTEEIFESESFPIEVLLLNQGEAEVEAGGVTITLKGIRIADFSGIVSDGVLSNVDLIDKIAEFNPQGGEETIDFTSGEEDAVYLGDIVGAHYPVNVFGEVVYDYTTYSSVQDVCFKENPREEGICDVEETKTVFSSGAPIQVVSAIEKRAGTGKVAVEFKIENVGGGSVSKPGTDFDTRFDQLTFAPGDDLWECKAAGKTNEGRFDTNNRLTIVCKLKDSMEDGALYVDELALTLDYKYKVLIQRSLRIREQ